MKGFVALMSGSQVWRRAAFLVLALACFVVVGAPGCGGSSNKASAVLSQESCNLDSDCGDAGLICALGACRLQCQSDADCAGGNCIIGTGPTGAVHAVCQPSNAPCNKPSDCAAPLACASDFRCRNLCTVATEATDCNSAGITGRICAMDANGVLYCAEPTEISDAGVIVEAPPAGVLPDAAAVTEPTATAIAADLAQQEANDSMDATVATATPDGSIVDTGVATPDSAVIGTDTGTTPVTDSGTTSMTDSGTAVVDAGGTTPEASAPVCVGGCPNGKACVNGTCEPCGTQGEACCPGTPCGANLVCNASNVCDCGNANEPCCGGASCTGISCVTPDAGGAPMCTCGTAGINCCPATVAGGAKTCIGGLFCGGTQCGCTIEYTPVAGATYAVARLVDGTLQKVSGSNTNTQLNNIYQPVTTSASAPLRVPNARSLVVSGYYYNAVGCAVQGDGSVWCFPISDQLSDSTYLGINGNTNMAVQNAQQVCTDPQCNGHLSGVVQISGGTYSTPSFCAVDALGAVWCWGYNGSGQLGTTDVSLGAYARNVQTSAIANFGGAAEVTIGYEAACARKTDNSIWCWGSNGQGEFGVPSSTINHSYVPYQVSITGSAVPVRLITGPTETMCAIMQDMTITDPTANTSVVCWGYNGAGVAGAATTNSTAGPTTILSGAGLPPLTGIVDLTGDGQSSVCIRTYSTDDVLCWGGDAQSTPYPAKYLDSSSRPLVNIASPIYGTYFSTFGYVDQFGKVAVGTSDTGPQPSCGMLTLPDGGAF